MTLADFFFELLQRFKLLAEKGGNKRRFEICTYIEQHLVILIWTLATFLAFRLRNEGMTRTLKSQIVTHAVAVNQQRQMIKFKSTTSEVDDFECWILFSHFYHCMFMLVKFKDNPSTTQCILVRFPVSILWKLTISKQKGVVNRDTRESNALVSTSY